MKWNEVGRVIGKLAPMIASAVGGPLAGSAVTTMEAAFGLKPEGALDARQDQIAKTLALASPEMLLALKTADRDFQVKMTELGFADAEALAKLESDDRMNARGREIALRDFTPRALAIGVTAGFFGLLLFMCLRQVPAASKDILNIMIGSLGAAWVTIVSYYFGSSSESSKKTDLLAGVK
jgi:hypothetical protein